MGSITMGFGQIAIWPQFDFVLCYSTVLKRNLQEGFDAGKRTACVVVCVTGIVEPKEWSNSMAKNGPQNVCCARAQLGQNNWQERGRMYISSFKMSCDRNFVVATDVVCCLFAARCLLLLVCLLLVSVCFFCCCCCCCCWPVDICFPQHLKGRTWVQDWALTKVIVWTGVGHAELLFPFLQYVAEHYIGRWAC